MLSIYNIKSTSAAMKYFEQDDYYISNSPEHQNGTEWFGKGAEELGLKGIVEKDDFRKIMDGNLPNGVKLGRQENGELVHAPGIDLTFSAPKSVSIQAEVYNDQKVFDAHNKAVKNTLSYIQKNMIQTRKTVKGELIYEDVNNITAMLIRHDTSRNQDPQLHTHCLLANAVKRDDGQWRSAYFGEIFDNKLFLGQIYRSELAYELEQQGYEIKITSNQSDFELTNIPQSLIEKFSSRAKEINEAAKEYDLVDAKLKAELALKTRSHKEVVDKDLLRQKWQEIAKEHEAKQALELANKPSSELKTKDKVLSYLESRWEKFCSVFSFENYHKVRHITQDILGIVSAEKQAVEYAIKHLSERSSVWKEVDLTAIALGYATGKIRISDIEYRIQQLKREGVLLTSANYPGRLTTKASLEKELETIELMKSGKGKAEALYSKEQVMEYCKDTGLNKGQVESLELILTTNDRMVGVQGYAGVGKTYMMQHLRSLAANAGYNIIGMAPSSSAARTLENEAGIKSHTIHSFLFNYDGLIHGRGTEEGKVLMRQELKNTILLLDEASLASTSQMNGLAKISKELEVRVVLAGDSKQIDAVEAGKPFYQLQRAGMKTALMGEIIRQENNPKLKAAIYNTINSDITSAFSKLKDNIIEIDEENSLAAEAAKKYLASNDRENTILVAPSRQLRAEINQEVRKGLKAEGILKETDTEFGILVRKGFTDVQHSKSNNYKVGDVVLFNRRYVSLGIGKNEYLAVKEVKNNLNVIVLKNDKGKEIGWHPDKVGGNRKGAIEVYKRSSINIQPNEKIRWTRNSKAYPDIVNSRTATIKEIDTKHVTVVFESGEIQKLPINDPVLKHMDNVYAFTIHAAQGQTSKYVIGVLEAKHPHLTNQKLFYVIISRAKDGLYLLTDDKTELLKELIANPGERIASTEHQGIQYRTEALQDKQKKPVIDKFIQATSLSHKEPASLKPSFRVQDIYSALYKNLAATFPEFGFINKGSYYISTTERKVDGSSGKKGKVHVYANNPGVLVDFTRGNKSIWDYIKDSYMPSAQKADIMEYLINLSGLGKLISLKELRQPVIPTPEVPKSQVQVDKKLLNDIYQFAKDGLFKGNDKILNYLKTDRNYDEATIKAMGLGSIHSKTILGQYLRSLGWDGDKIKEAYKLLGLIGKTHNLVIPYKDAKGELMGFAARNINYKEDDKYGKYMYSKGLSKGDTLFNMHNNSSKELVIVEGVFDCLHANAKGMNNVVALGGTGFNNSQLKLIENAGINKITLCLDNDKAGQEAGQKILDIISKNGSKLEVKQVSLPAGIKDPDQLITDKGVRVFKELIDNAKSLKVEIKTESIKSISQTVKNDANIASKDIDKSKGIELEI